MDTATTGTNYGLSNTYGASVISFVNNGSHQVEGIYVTNSTYAALSMKHGDTFAKKFGGDDGNDEDWFKLSVWGKIDGSETDTVEFYLADYRFADNEKDYIIETWQWLDLSTLGNVDSLLFSLSSSDDGMWGMNTPAYFCMDNMTILDNAPVLENSIADITEKDNATDKVIDVSNVFSDVDDDSYRFCVQTPILNLFSNAGRQRFNHRFYFRRNYYLNH